MHLWECDLQRGAPPREAGRGGALRPCSMREPGVPFRGTPLSSWSQAIGDVGAGTVEFIFYTQQR